MPKNKKGFFSAKENPLNPTPAKSTSDPLYSHFEKGIQNWWSNNKYKYPYISSESIPTNYDPIHNEDTKPAED